jgi:hypothetical protein
VELYFDKKLGKNEIAFGHRGPFIRIPTPLINHIIDIGHPEPTEDFPWWWTFVTPEGEVQTLKVSRFYKGEKREFRMSTPLQSRTGAFGKMLKPDTVLQFTFFDGDGPTLIGMVNEARSGSSSPAATDFFDKNEVFRRMADADDRDDVFRRVISERKVRIRAKVFRDQIVENFDAMCAFGGITINTADGFSNMEAAHIIPVSSGGSDAIGNGLCLSRDLHWAFDQGLLTLRPDLTIQVSSSAATTGSLVHLEGIPIRMSKISPDPAAIKFHREHVFKS